ncbi:hypothetical protein H072_1895 [Dactylellina haptotyla CBS 200.50]|uniref:AB hydrolase-1 domain-containing protein n=1 Tax=Dactylellina haptotyla (strain CBS 200.50) TaxID=1284197 RepID=S8AT08_DACHA|nr:hypothetical protein H072_1895 [Dactylellina haptotyla CBS 200.50]
MRADADDIETYALNDDLSVFEHFFTVPLNYTKPDGPTITIFARIVKKREVPVKPKKKKETKSDESEQGKDEDDAAYLCYLNGGPGFSNASANTGYISKFVDKGYAVVLLDQRGTGLSECICPENIRGETAEEKAEYVSHFRADNIVRDCEFVREKLLGKDGSWSLAGQSFGGFCIATYLSFAPEHLVEAFMFGGIPPVGESTPDKVYLQLYNKLKARNLVYYNKYPKDIDRVKDIAEYLSKNTVVLPSGGTLTLDRFRDIGIMFGMHGGIDSIHKLVFQAQNDLSRFGKILTPTLSKIEQYQSFDDAILYCILHEPIYCQDGNASRWSANREPRQQSDPRLQSYEVYQQLTPPKTGVDGALFFTGEMVFPSMLDDYAILRQVKDVGNILSEKKWEGRLYDLDALVKNTVPVYAATYMDDMYVDFELTRKFAGVTGNFHEFITNSMYHNAISAKTTEVIDKLWELRKGCAD